MCGVCWGKGVSVGSWRRRDIGVLQRSQATAGLLRANYTFARPGNGVAPFMGYVRGLVGIDVFCFASRQACMRGQPFTWGEDNLGCRWCEDGMGARRGKKDHANGWTSFSVGSWEPV